MAASPAGATPVIVPKAQPVPLTPEEKVLFDRIDFELSGEYESRMESLAAAADLAESLIARDAIPEVRRRYLTNPLTCWKPAPISARSHRRYYPCNEVRTDVHSRVAMRNHPNVPR